MSQKITVFFDGHTLQPGIPLDLEPNQHYVITVEPEPVTGQSLREILAPFVDVGADPDPEPPAPRDLTFDANAIPIWELAAQIAAQVPDAEWQKLPTDLARRFDQYQNSQQEQP